MTRSFCWLILTEEIIVQLVKILVSITTHMIHLQVYIDLAPWYCLENSWVAWNKMSLKQALFKRQLGVLKSTRSIWTASYAEVWYVFTSCGYVFFVYPQAANNQKLPPKQVRHTRPPNRWWVCLISLVGTPQCAGGGSSRNGMEQSMACNFNAWQRHSSTFNKTTVIRSFVCIFQRYEPSLFSVRNFGICILNHTLKIFLNLPEVSGWKESCLHFTNLK